MRLSFISSAVLFLVIACIRAQEEEGAGSDITWDETAEQSDNSVDFYTPYSEEAQESPADDAGDEADWASPEDDVYVQLQVVCGYFLNNRLFSQCPC